MRNKIVVGVFLALIALLFPLYNLLMPGVSVSLHEKRNIAQFPDIRETGIKAFPDAFNEYTRDNAPLRVDASLCNSFLNKQLFGALQSDMVLLGKDEWLFYKEGPSYAPMGYYQHSIVFTPQQEEEICRALAAVQEKLAQQGTEFLLLIAPGKETVYGEYVPDCYPVLDTPGRTERLVDAIGKTTDVPVVFPLQQLQEHKTDLQLYYRLDTHWNYAGASVALNCALEELQLPVPDFADYRFEDGGIATGDLANLGALFTCVKDERDTVLANPELGGAISSSVAVYGDSFRNFFGPVLSARCEKYLLTDWTAGYDFSAAPDVAILVLTERNLIDIPAVLAAWQ